MKRVSCSMSSVDDLHFEASSLACFRELLQELGGDPGLVASRCNYTLAELEGVGQHLDYHTYCNLLEAAAAETNCPHFGLLLGRRSDLSLLGTLGLLAKHCSSFGGAIQALIRYYNIASLGEVFRLERGAQTSMFIREPITPDLAYSIQTQDVTLCEAVQMSRELLESKWVPAAVYLNHEPENTRIYQSVFGCPVYFNQDIQALAFPTADLDLPLKKANSANRKDLEQQMATFAQQQKKSFLLQAQQAIKLGLVVGDCSVNFTADKLSLHTRTLHRKLRRENTSFTELLDSTRRHLADHLVSNTPMSIFNVGQTLGYSDDTAFSRSFRRWFGTPPSRWRQQKAR